jgi:hypothetical protein
MFSTRARRAAPWLAAAVLVIPFAGGSANAAGPPTGEVQVGHSAIEPAYNADTGTIIYLKTPSGAPFPTHTNAHAVSPLYLVEYPPGTTVGTLNCEGVPGNCPDHDGLVAQVATNAMPSVYGTDPTLVPGHDHIVDPPGAPDFNVAWEVVEIVFTSKAAANTHLVTDTAIEAAVQNGDAIEIDLGFAFHCSVAPASQYAKGTPIG